MNVMISREHYKSRYLTPPRQQYDSSSMAENLRMIQLRRYRTDSIYSHYDNDIKSENNSKWSIVRQRLPDILALSTTYKPTNIRTQLTLLIALMNRQTNELRRLSTCDFNQNLATHPTSVIVNLNNRNRLISLKRIPTEQVIHVDIDGPTFSIPTRQFIIAISRGYAHETAVRYCPPAISDMLINLSKTKVIDEGRQYKRALFKMRVGKFFFFSLFIFISGMMLALIIGTTNTIIKLNALNHTNPNATLTSNPTPIETDEFWLLT